MKALLLTVVLFAGSAFAAIGPDPATRVYGIHLHFDETEAVDELTLITDIYGGLSGRMHVPGDFDGDITNITEAQDAIAFDLLVPKNAGRPVDMIFHYDLKFFDAADAQAIGFVTIKDHTDFVASLVAFLRTK